MFVYPGKLILIAKKKNYKCIYGINIKNNKRRKKKIMKNSHWFSKISRKSEEHFRPF